MPTIARASDVLLSPDARYLAAEEDDKLSCSVPSGTCDLVGDTSVTDAEGVVVIPTGDPMDT